MTLHIVLCSLAMHELRNRNVSIGKLYEQKNSQKTHATKNFASFYNHSELYDYGSITIFLVLENLKGIQLTTIATQFLVTSFSIRSYCYAAPLFQS